MPYWVNVKRFTKYVYGGGNLNEYLSQVLPFMDKMIISFHIENEMVPGFGNYVN